MSFTKLICIKKCDKLGSFSTPNVGEMVYSLSSNRLRYLNFNCYDLIITYRKDKDGKYNYIGSYEKEYFLTLEEWRELKISKILEE